MATYKMTYFGCRICNPDEGKPALLTPYCPIHFDKDIYEYIEELGCKETYGVDDRFEDNSEG